MKKLYAILITGTVFIGSANAQVLLNGNMELWPPNCPFNVPPNSWTNFSTSLAPDQAGCAGPVVSIQGSSHMNLVWSNTGLREGCTQQVTSLAPGAPYIIQFFAIHDQGLYASTGSVFLDVYLNSSVIFSTPELFNGGVWTQYAIGFMANNTSETIGFQIRDGNTGTSGSVGVDSVTVDYSLGVAPAANFEFSMYPNPAKSRITLTGSEFLNSVTITDLSGKLVSEKNDLSVRSMIYELPELAPGLYFVHLRTEKGVTIKKLMIE